MTPGNLNQLTLFTKVESKPRLKWLGNYFPFILMFLCAVIISRKLLWGPCGAAVICVGRTHSGCLTHADGVGGVQLAAVGAFAVEGAGHVATRSVDARAGLALVDIWKQTPEVRTHTLIQTDPHYNLTLTRTMCNLCLLSMRHMFAWN